MKPLKHFLVNVTVNGAVLWFIVNKIPALGLEISHVYDIGITTTTIIIFGILGIVFWLINSVLKNILNILTLPVRIITLGLSSLLLNLAVLYIFESVVTRLNIGITVHLGNLQETFILSAILSAIYFIIKKII